MPGRRASLVPFAFLGALLGCGSPSGQSDAGPELARPPAVLRARADAALEAGDADLAYRYLALIHALHPGSPEDAAAFPIAVRLFKRAYDRHRITDPGSIWVGSEPAFVFQWVGSYFGPAAFPQAEVNALLLGMPHGFFRDFEAFAARQPAMRAWTIEVEDDNGIIRSVAARPAADPMRRSSSR